MLKDVQVTFTHLVSSISDSATVDAFGIVCADSGLIQVDDQLRLRGHRHIFVAGEIVDRPMAHLAANAKVFAGYMMTYFRSMFVLVLLFYLFCLHFCSSSCSTRFDRVSLFSFIDSTILNLTP